MLKDEKKCFTFPSEVSRTIGLAKPAKECTQSIVSPLLSERRRRVADCHADSASREAICRGYSRPEESTGSSAPALSDCCAAFALTSHRCMALAR